MEINQLKLSDMFADPAALYEQLVNRKGYVPRSPVTDFDAELISTGWVSLGCTILCVMIHREKRAHIVMLSSEDLSAMREALAEVQTSLNTVQLLKAGRPGSVFGFGL